MGLISPAQTSDGTTIDAADLNNPINTIANEFNGNIDNSNIKSAAAIDGSKIASASITNTQLAANAAWTAYTPTWTSTGTAPSIGNGTLAGRYQQVGKTVNVQFKFTAGSTTTFGTGTYIFTFPVTAAAGVYNTIFPLGFALSDDTGASSYPSFFIYFTTTTFTLRVITSQGAGSDTTSNAVTSTRPLTFGNGDGIYGSFAYEAA